MEDLADVPVGSLDGSEPATSGAFAPNFGDLPVPNFERRRRRAQGVTFGVEPEQPPETVTSSSMSADSEELHEGNGTEGSLRSMDSNYSGYAVQPGNVYAPYQDVQNMSPDRRGPDPWLQNDPWQAHGMENWSDVEASSTSGQSDQWSAYSWNGSFGRWNNWEWKTGRQSDYDTNSNWSWRSSSWSTWNGPGQGGHSLEVHGDDHGRALWQDHHHAVPLRHDSGQRQGDGEERALLDPTSPVATVVAKDSINRPNGEIPSGVPSVVGNGSNQANAMTGKLSSTYPPIFYARPGESWEQYWRSVMFWVASEGKSLPDEMRGPRLMQQLRERAGKIVQHLTVQEVANPDGIELIKKTMERSPIIKLLDQKKIDQRRQKFMKLTRLPHESLESFINRAEIYRRENQSSPAYQVGSQFYVGHLIDAAKLTKRDQALLKAACGGTLDDEDAVATSLIDLADQLEGVPGCPIGRGEPTLDQEDRYLVQKPGSTTSLTASTATSGDKQQQSYRRNPRRKFFGRKKFRDALMAILEDDDLGEEDEEDPLADALGEESCDEDDGAAMGDMNAFSPPDNSPMEANVTQPPMQNPTGAMPPFPVGPLAEIYAQDYKARNRVREIKKMRQYFQKEANGNAGGNTKEREQVKRWVKEQQKTEACFICRQLGHWSQECPYRNRAPVHASNVTFPGPPAHQTADWSVLQQCVQSDARYKVVQGKAHGHHEHVVHVQQVQQVHDVYWSMSEMGNKMILDLGCMKTVAGATWINPVVKQWKRHGYYIKVVPENESFRFGDGHVRHSKFSVVLHVNLAGIPCLLRISVVAGDCPPLLSKPVCTALKFMIDTETHTLSSRKFAIKAYGFSQSKGGHYLMPVDELQHCQPVPPEMQLERHLEVLPLISQCSGSNHQMIAAPTDQLNSDDPPSSGHGRGCSFVGVGASGPGVFKLTGGGSDGCRGSQAQEERQVAISAPSTTNLFANSDTIGVHAATIQTDAGNDAANAGYDGPSRHASTNDDGKQFRRCAQDHSGQAEGRSEAQQACSLDRPGSSLPDPVSGVLRGRHIQHGSQPAVPDHHLQVEDATLVAPHQAGRGRAAFQTALETQSPMDHAHARSSLSDHLGTCGIRAAAMLQPEGLLPGNGHGAEHRGGRGAGSGGAEKDLQSEETMMPITDPNAATEPEQLRREGGLSQTMQELLS